MTNAFALAALLQLVASGGPLALVTLRCFKNNVAPDRSTALTALQECDFTGYTAVAAIAWGTPYIDPTGLVRMDAPSEDFSLTGTGTLNTVYGWYMTNAGNTVLYGAATVPVPINLTAAGQGFRIQPTYAYGD